MKMPIAYIVSLYFMCPHIGTWIDEKRGVKFPEGHYKMLEARSEYVRKRMPPWPIWLMFWVEMTAFWCFLDYINGVYWW